MQAYVLGPRDLAQVRLALELPAQLCTLREPWDVVSTGQRGGSGVAHTRGAQGMALGDEPATGVDHVLAAVRVVARIDQRAGLACHQRHTWHRTT